MSVLGGYPTGQVGNGMGKSAGYFRPTSRTCGRIEG